MQLLTNTFWLFIGRRGGGIIHRFIEHATSLSTPIYDETIGAITSDTAGIRLFAGIFKWGYRDLFAWMDR
jgi:hypothetical protein